MHRAGSHGAGMATCVLLMPGTQEDEERLKTAAPWRAARQMASYAPPAVWI